MDVEDKYAVISKCINKTIGLGDNNVREGSPHDALEYYKQAMVYVKNVLKRDEPESIDKSRFNSLFTELEKKISNMNDVIQILGGK